MTNSQKLGIICVLSIAGWALWAVGRYWVATHFMPTAKNYQFFVKTQDPQYLITSFNNFQSASKMNPREPAILSETTVSAAYIATALAQSNATAAGQLAQLSVSLSQLSISFLPIIQITINPPPVLISSCQTFLPPPKSSPTLKNFSHRPRLPYNLGIIYKYLNATDSARLQFQNPSGSNPTSPIPRSNSSNWTNKSTHSIIPSWIKNQSLLN